ncbi:MAG: hypothetical protein HQL56_08275 [Magnetococcales bacterium]|nr:hypothetical protein [Magnetococcales bacterium]
MDESGPKEMEPEQHEAVERLRRRRLLKGLAAGVPMVMTLSSGARAAMSSDNCQAAFNGITTNPPTGLNFDCVQAADGTLSRTQRKWYRQARSAFTANTQNVALSTGDTTEGAQGVNDPSDRCIVYITNDGSTIQSTADATHHPISVSCWNSFMG